MTELLPCPFCGSPAAWRCLEDEPGSPASFWVNCSCGVQTPERRTEAEVLDLWNRRALRGAPAQRVEGAADIVDEAACLIWAELCPGIVMGDEDSPRYEAAARAVLALSTPSPAGSEPVAWREEIAKLIKIAEDPACSPHLIGLRVCNNLDRYKEFIAATPELHAALREALEACRLLVSWEDRTTNDSLVATHDAAVAKARAALAQPSAPSDHHEAAS